MTTQTTSAQATTTQAATGSAEAAIRAELARWQQAILARDVPAIMNHYAADIVAFDAVLQLQFKGIAAYQDHWNTCMTMCPAGESLFEFRDLTVTTSGDLAFCHALVLCGVIPEDGPQCGGWSRMTACYRRIDNQWKVVHEHFSMPIDPASNLALHELTP